MPSVLPDRRSGLHHYRQELVVQGPCTHFAMKPERRIYTYTIMCCGICMFRPARPTFIPVVSWSTVSHSCLSMDPGAKALPLEINHATLLRASQRNILSATYYLNCTPTKHAAVVNTTAQDLHVYPSVCVCFLPIHSGHQVRWTYQPGSHRRKVTQDF